MIIKTPSNNLYQRQKTNKEGKKMRQIYESLKCTEKEFNEIYNTLTPEEQRIVSLINKSMNDSSVRKDITEEERIQYNKTIRPKLRRRLNKYRKEQPQLQPKTTEQKSPSIQKEEITKEEQQKILNILKHPLFRETLENSLTYEELALFQLQVEYAEKKNLSVENLASFLQIKEEKIWNINRKALLLCKEKINTCLDSMIELTTNPIEDQEVHTKLVKE